MTLREVTIEKTSAQMIINFHFPLLTLPSIATFLTFQRNSIMATINATQQPTKSTRKTPPTFAMNDTSH